MMNQENNTREKTDNDEKGSKYLKRYFIFFVSIFLLIGSYSLGLNQGKKEQASQKPVPLSQSLVENKLPSAEEKIDFSLFWKVWDLVKEKHIDKDKLDAQKMVYGSINGLLKATGDPYSTFFDPQESKSFSEEIEGIFEVIGAELGIKEEILTVIAPLDGSPAQKAGLRPGDKILKIDDKITTDLTVYQAVDLIRGKKGTVVKLIILHKDEQETTEVEVTRNTIEVKSVTLEMKDDKIAYIKISKFGENTTKEFNNAISKITVENTRGIILDLRNNPGGLLDKSVDIANKMIPKGKIIVTEEDSVGNKESLKTSGGDKLSPIQTIVLINEGSASASEILAGALRDNQGLTLVGKKTFGKGSVQELINLPGGSSVKVTIAKWLTPNGEYIMEKGINPDIEVDLSIDDFNNDRDPQLDKAMEVMKERIK